MTISQRTAIRRVLHACLGITWIFVSQVDAGVQDSKAVALILTAKYLSRLPSAASTPATPIVTNPEPKGTAGEIFGIPVSMVNYSFAKRVAYTFRLLGKQTEDLQDFPKEQDAYLRKVEMKKKYQALKQRVEQLKKAARLKIFVRRH